MKLSVIMGAIGAAMLTLSSANAAGTSQYIVETSTDAFFQNTPGYMDHERLAGGQHYRVKVDSTREADAVYYWQNAGLSTQEDVKLTRSYFNPASQSSVVTSQNTPLFNDTLFDQQASLLNSTTGYAQGILAFRNAKRLPRIAVLDTGASPHEDFAIKAGFSFTTLFGQTENDNYRPFNTENGVECIGVHGDQMLGIVGAKQNNSRGITGIANAELYVGRVMSTSCNPDDPADAGDVGLISDLYNGILWAIGEYADYPLTNPVDVINISLAADIPCPVVLQEAIDNANAKGVAVVVSSGNSAVSTDRFTPANCSGVITVGAHDETLSKASYSNSGDHVAFLAHGTYKATETDYGTAQNDSIYTDVAGTSGAAAAISGFAGLIKSSYPDATPEQIKAIMVEAAGCTGVTPCNNPIIASNLAAITEAVLDPKISFNHVFSGTGCQDSKQKDALSGVINVCGAYRIDVKSELASLGNSYSINVLRRAKNVSYADWSDTTGKIELIGSYNVTSNDESIGLKNINHAEYDYAAVSCYEDFCPAPVELDLDSSNTAPSCR